MYDVSSLVRTMKYNFEKVQRNIPELTERPVLPSVLAKEQQEYALDHLKICKNAVLSIWEHLEKNGHVSYDGGKQSCVPKIILNCQKETLDGICEKLCLDDLIITSLIGTLSDKENKIKDSSAYVVRSMGKLILDEVVLKDKGQSIMYPEINLTDINIVALTPHITALCGRNEGLKYAAAQNLYSVLNKICSDNSAKDILRSLPHKKKIGVISEVFKEVPDPNSIDEVVLMNYFPEFF